MAAPSNTVWGSVSGQGKLGIAISASNTNTQTTLTVDVWLALRYNIDDSNNKYNFSYTNDSGTTATSSESNLSLNFGTTSGSGWADVSQKKIKTHTLTYTRGTSSKTVKFSAELNNLGSEDYDVFASTSYTIPALQSYTISYNANGGSGAPSSQTKYYGKSLTLSSTKPTRTGYTFEGWALSKADADSGTWYYQAGGSCGKNENLTLYATWEEHKLTVNYYSNYADYCTYQGEVLDVSASSNIQVATSNFLYDNAYNNGLSNIQNSEYLYLSRTGYTPTGYWGTSTNGGTLVDQNTSFATGQALAQALGKNLASGNASINIYPQWKINTYTIGYDGNGGYGSMDVQSVDWQETFILLDNKFKREGYKFVGWNAQREADRKWYVNGQGWVTEDEITANAYEKKLYLNQDELIFDLSWIRGETGVIHQYTMYAVWEISGVIYIDSGTTLEPYLTYIDNGTGWDLYLAYIDSGTDWNIIS